MAPPRHPLGPQRTCFFRAREQARWRGESWLLTWEEWWGLWEPNWRQRGRGRDDLCMMRLDPDEGWSLANVVIVTRITYLRRRNEYRRQ